GGPADPRRSPVRCGGVDPYPKAIVAAARLQRQPRRDARRERPGRLAPRDVSVATASPPSEAVADDPRARRRGAGDRGRRVRHPRPRPSPASARDDVRRCAATEDPFLRRAIDAMRVEPYLVGGRDRDDSSIMEAAPDLAVKEGAEALNCGVSMTAGIGVAVKIADGGYRAVGPATVAVLDELGFLPAAARRRLRAPKGVEPIAHLSTRRS